jgi:hypothetical protein
MMFTLDLLKGKGVPEKTDVRRIIIRAFGLLPPLAALALLAGAWYGDHLKQSRQEAGISENKQVITQHADQIRSYGKAKSRVGLLHKQLDQTDRALQCRIPMTNLLRQLTETLPADIFIHDFRLNRAVRTEKYQAEGSQEPQQRQVIGRTLTITLCDYNTSGGDRLVQGYADELKTSGQANRLFNTVQVTACQPGQADGRDATFYNLECQLVEQSQ